MDGPQPSTAAPLQRAAATQEAVRALQGQRAAQQLLCVDVPAVDDAVDPLGEGHAESPAGGCWLEQMYLNE
jgi:hypothetical protein